MRFGMCGVDLPGTATVNGMVPIRGWQRDDIHRGHDECKFAYSDTE